MLKKVIKYTDYNGAQKEKVCYFNLSRAELMEMQLETSGGLDVKIKAIVESKNVPEIVKIFKDLILKSYGVKSEDGERFIKNQALRDEFAQSEAYTELFMELASNDKAAAEFVNGILPVMPKEANPAAIPGKAA